MANDTPTVDKSNDLDDLPEVPRPVSTRRQTTGGDPDIPSASEPGASLVILAGPNAGSTIILTDEETIVGMNGERWLKLTQRSGDVMIEVVDPTVMVMRNGQPLPPTESALTDGDTLGVHDFEMVFNTNT